VGKSVKTYYKYLWCNEEVVVIELEYKGPYEGEYWEMPTYRELVRVYKGRCKVKYEDTAQTLEMHGFVRVTKSEPVKKVEVSVDTTPAPLPESSRERKVIEMYRDGNASVSMISKTLRMSKKKVEAILETYKACLNEGDRNV